VSASKAKGTAAETAVVRFLQANGYPHAERRALAGAKDRGDIAGIPGVVVEVKAARRFELAAWMDETLVEAMTVGADQVPMLVVKRPGQGNPADWYWIVDGLSMIDILDGRHR
jgi:Holliday junction resolvase